MQTLESIENRRLLVQSVLDAAKTQAERNKLGQFATPSPLATEMLEYARLHISPDLPIRFLDPAIGTGSFLSALLRTFPATQIAHIRGIEVDAKHAQKTRELWHDHHLQLDVADFTQVAPPTSNEAKANLLICNPPYVRHHHLLPEEKRRLQAKVQQIAGIHLPGLAGLYCYFLALAHAWMAEEALAGWLLPSEFLDVNYGQSVKQYLLSQVTLLHVHRFAPKDLQFDKALVSSAIIWLKKRLPPPDHTIAFSYGGTLSQPQIGKRFSLETVRRTAKWSQLPFLDEPIQVSGKSEGKEKEMTKRQRNVPVVSDLFTIKRGLVTGSNKFFLFTRAQIRSHQLPEAFFVPVLPSPRYVEENEIGADRDGHPLLDKVLFLLKCHLPEAEVRTRFPRLWTYLQSGVAEGIHQGYLCQHRVPWYMQEDRPPSPLLCTYMGRQNTALDKPFRFLLNHSTATATNVYLMLYPKPQIQERFQKEPELLRLCWRALNAIPAPALISEGRVYGDGLFKLEPRELGSVPLDVPIALSSEMDKVTQMTLFSC